LRLKYQICTPHVISMARLVCRKCGIEFPLKEWEQVAEVQRMSCGVGGTHKLVGVS